MFAKPNPKAWQPHRVPPVDVLSESKEWQICMSGIFPSCNLNWEPGNPTSRALDARAMDGDVTKAKAKDRMTLSVLVMMAGRRKRSRPQLGVEGDWQPL